MSAKDRTESTTQSCALQQTEDNFESACGVILDRQQDQGRDSNSGGAAISISAIAHHQCFWGGDAELLERNLEEAGIRLLHSVLERQRVAIDELAETVMIEVRRQADR